MLKARTVQILISQIGKNCISYKDETCTHSRLTIAYQVGSMVRLKLLCICLILMKNLRKNEHIFQKIYALNSMLIFKTIVAERINMHQ